MSFKTAYVCPHLHPPPNTLCLPLSVLPLPLPLPPTLLVLYKASSCTVGGRERVRALDQGSRRQLVEKTILLLLGL